MIGTPKTLKTALTGNTKPPIAPRAIKSAKRTITAPNKAANGSNVFKLEDLMIIFKTLGTTIPTKAIGPTILVIKPIQTPNTINNNRLLNVTDFLVSSFNSVSPNEYIFNHVEYFFSTTNPIILTSNSAIREYIFALLKLPIPQKT